MTDEKKLQLMQLHAEKMVTLCDALGVVVTVEQKPVSPLAMGNHETVVSVRLARSGV